MDHFTIDLTENVDQPVRTTLADWREAITGSRGKLRIRRTHANRARKYYRKFLSSKNVVHAIRHIRYSVLANIPASIYPIGVDNMEYNDSTKTQTFEMVFRYD